MPARDLERVAEISLVNIPEQGVSGHRVERDDFLQPAACRKEGRQAGGASARIRVAAFESRQSDCAAPPSDPPVRRHRTCHNERE